jgi:hypothetical protein
MNLTEIQKLLIPYQIDYKVRLGSKIRDGGYIMSQKYLTTHLVSAGCDDITSFEEDYLLHIPEAKIDIYDGRSACSLAEKNTNVSFHSKNVYKLSDLNWTYGCNAQIDIEGSELAMFLYPDDDLRKINQMSLEIHLNRVGTEEAWIQCLKNLNSTHTIIHIHANNYEISTRYGVPSVLELSYIKNDFVYNMVKETVSFPISGLDIANNQDKEDIPMGWWLS